VCGEWEGAFGGGEARSHHAPTTLPPRKPPQSTHNNGLLKAVCVGKLRREAKVKARLSLWERGLSLWELALSLRKLDLSLASPPTLADQAFP
jgi:hypothetical protein